MYICIYIYSYMFDIFLIPQISTQLSNSTDNISISATGSTGTGVDTEKAGALVLDSPGFKKRLLHLPPKMGGKNEATFFSGSILRLFNLWTIHRLALPVRSMDSSQWWHAIKCCGYLGVFPMMFSICARVKSWIINWGMVINRLIEFYIPSHTH